MATSLYEIWPLSAPLISSLAPPTLSLSSATVTVLLFHKLVRLLLASVPRFIYLRKQTLLL